MKKKILYALLSAVVAFGLWLYVVNVVSPESEATFYNVPVILNNEDVLKERGMMVVADKDPTVTLRLEGNRSDLNQLKNSDITVLCDLSKVTTTGELSLNYDVSFQGGNAFTILDQSPAVIPVTIAQWSTKEVDVVVNYSGSVPADYIVDKENAELDYKKVTVTGPASVVDRITQARIDVDLTNQTQTLIQGYRYTLCDADGEPVDAAQVTTNLAEVNLTVRIQKTKELLVVLDVTYGGGATADTTQILIDPLTIKVAGSEKLLEGLENIRIGSVDLSQVAEDTVLTYPISLPEGITNLTGKSEVTVDISFRDLMKAELKITNFRYTPPEGMAVTWTPDEITVTVRGNEEDIRSIQSTDVWVRIDLSNAELGDNQYKAEVSIINPTMESVGVVGSYTVTITLEEDTQEAS